MKGREEWSHVYMYVSHLYMYVPHYIIYIYIYIIINVCIYSIYVGEGAGGVVARAGDTRLAHGRER